MVKTTWDQAPEPRPRHRQTAHRPHIRKPAIFSAPHIYLCQLSMSSSTTHCSHNIGEKNNDEPSPLLSETTRPNVLTDYLKRIEALYRETEWPRQNCPRCNASRHIYCFDCCRLLIPEKEWPPPTLNHQWDALPFQLDIILDDRRAASTGVQLATLLKNIRTQNGQSVVRIWDQDGEDGIPNYKEQHIEAGSPMETYALFPGEKSVPLSSINGLEHKNLRLVVLDCRWKNCTRLLDRLSLPMVHLDNPPSDSHYWRWHNSGPGCLSSAEAVFWAAWQLSQGDDRLLDIMWLFAVQRSVILRRFDAEVTERTIPHLPFTDQAKEQAREMRRRQNTFS